MTRAGRRGEQREREMEERPETREIERLDSTLLDSKKLALAGQQEEWQWQCNRYEQYIQSPVSNIQYLLLAFNRLMASC